MWFWRIRLELWWDDLERSAQWLVVIAWLMLSCLFTICEGYLFMIADEGDLWMHIPMFIIAMLLFILPLILGARLYVAQEERRQP